MAGLVEDMKVPRWIDNRTVEQSDWLYHKFNNTKAPR